MSATVQTLLNSLSKIDRDAIYRRFPDEKWKNKFDGARSSFEIVLKKTPTEGRTSPDFVREVESATTQMAEIYDYLYPETELGSRARLNESVMWATADYAERAIYLAGVGREAKIKEPYRTQLRNLPAHACLQRYRQIWKIKEFILDNFDSGLRREIELIVMQMERSLLDQFLYFSTMAYSDNNEHVLSAYHKMLAHLLVAYCKETEGKKLCSEQHHTIAKSVILRVEEPKRRIHYMHRQYLQRMYREFSTFQRLSSRHSDILQRLKDIHDMAEALSDEDLHWPRQYFNISNFVQIGVRSASVAGLVLVGGAALGLEPGDVASAINHLWQISIEEVFGAGTAEAAKYVTLDTGGLALPATMDTGGLASPLLADTGGLAHPLEATNIASDLLLFA